MPCSIFWQNLLNLCRIWPPRRVVFKYYRKYSNIIYNIQVLCTNIVYYIQIQWEVLSQHSTSLGGVTLCNFKQLHWKQHILWVHQYYGFINTTGSSILRVHQYYGFIHSSITFSSISTIFIHIDIFHFSFIFHPIYLYYIMLRK
jgi:hypothetical protein